MKQISTLIFFSVIQNPLTYKKTEPAEHNEQILTKPDVSSKRKCETKVETEKAKMVLYIYVF